MRLYNRISNRFLDLFRKLVAEGPDETPNGTYSPVDIPLVRYAAILLNQVGAYNENGRSR